ncbi:MULTISPECIES: putative lipid II flippase FtsW [Nocardiaceae]|uniref:putative lipid II flippase FtsW n=1 Tax=Nocardiaceae TaxID=85025 RepID=UPI00036111B3|nr:MULTISPECIES: putative lipid II flippase FtsW [Rhodococcus]OZD13228.1 putative lipid II flippase FtsW [Rhodococcus sp. 06-156-4C]OZD16176.1 putative lipid II flippase FtsW [Rhodococcus sp. 06-156-3C]OZD17530.1 putative lipid II flippase FtsW [Rhodococcus sp. 06-156-4a]OZD34696.1 putative lipid II flippase FtsW [Rhodococcus sp. 06-156-3b]OZD36078.1 putative lipid II flippase FtsW [Rhodococcus sp. 06-156-3]
MARPENAPANSPRTRIGLWLGRPLASFHLIVTVAALLTILGLVMVLSSSAAEAYATDGSAYTLFTQQLIGVGLGVVAFYVALRTSVRVLRKVSFPLFCLSVVMLMMVLIPGIGSEGADGARRWFNVAGVSFQPSELAKVTLVLWGAHLLASRRSEHASLKSLLIPLVPAALLMAGLVVLQPNLSTAIAIGIILVSLLWFAGLDARLFAIIVGGGIAAATVLAFTAGYRSNRIKAWLNPGDDPQGLGYQSNQAKFSLADGGPFGVGLGQSRAKWSYLPNAHNDFIFAIIGEELGFIGCLAVLGLFALFVYTGLRIAMRSVDPFLRLLAAGSTTWIFAQAMINIGYVVGLLPVTGLQLPLVSYGGSSTAITLMMFGIIANAARHEPEAIAALHSGQDSRLDRVLRLPMPASFSPLRAAAARSKSTRPALDREDRRRIESGSSQRRAPDAGGRAGRVRGGEPPRRSEPRRTGAALPRGGAVGGRSGAVGGRSAAPRAGAQPRGAYGHSDTRGYRR